jgi:hypothetical protein
MQSRTTRLVAFAALVLPPVFFTAMPAAEAKQCSDALPSHPQGHWTYRLIDGRKCWYEGEKNFPKALLQWPEQAAALSAFDKAEGGPKEPPLAPVTQTERLVVEPGSLTDLESFEARWRSIESALSKN